MYVVRPAYLMTFLNIITSLTAKFADIIMDQENEVVFKTKFALMQESKDIKNTYLAIVIMKYTMVKIGINWLKNYLKNVKMH